MIKAKALLGKQRHKTQNLLTMNRKKMPAFYKKLCDTTTMTHPALCLLILTDVCTKPYTSYS